ncbi:hypothetical protein RJ641_009861 [Dillenia turbinata]|uniref:Uncharacterized protein n=1 Tax=Dillenia turbinata TaxID=194707 RepID=A0AAN8V4X9_9MAGN
MSCHTRARPTTSTFGATGFGQSPFSGQHGGSRVAAYIPTPETDATGSARPEKLESISGMPVYKDKNHEELRWEDYQLRDKGGPLPANQTTGGISFAASSTPSNPFASSSTFGQSSASLFSTSTSSSLFAPKTPAFSASGFGTLPPAFSSSPFDPPATSNIFGSTASTSTSIFGTASSAFGEQHHPYLETLSLLHCSNLIHHPLDRQVLLLDRVPPLLGRALLLPLVNQAYLIHHQLVWGSYSQALQCLLLQAVPWGLAKQLVLAVTPDLYSLFKKMPAEAWFHRMKKGKNDRRNSTSSESIQLARTLPCTNTVVFIWILTS